jgi:hypothetical protein
MVDQDFGDMSKHIYESSEAATMLHFVLVSFYSEVLSGRFFSADPSTCTCFEGKSSGTS